MALRFALERQWGGGGELNKRTWTVGAEWRAILYSVQQFEGLQCSAAIAAAPVSVASEEAVT